MSAQDRCASVPMSRTAESGEVPISNQSVLSDVTAGLDPTVPELVNEVLMADLVSMLEVAQQRSVDWNHCHIGYSSTSRISEDGVLIEFGAGFDLIVCSSWQCGAPADPGVSSWRQWARDNGQRILEGPALRSDEELAAVAIRTVIPQGQVEKLKETGLGDTPDFAVTLPDGSRSAVEVTMHTDGGRRQVSAAGRQSVDAGLQHDWHVLVQDQRFLSDYDGERSFAVKQVAEMLAAVLADVERADGELDDPARIAARCEGAIDRQWRWARGELLDQPPLAVTIRRADPAEGGRGSVQLSASTAVHHFSRVTDVSALTAAVQRCIDDKLAKDQWGDTADPKWLVVVLDEGEAATQLLGVTEFEDEMLDFSGIAFAELDEVWAVAFEDGTVTALRCTQADQPWRLYRTLPVDTGRDSTEPTNQ